MELWLSRESEASLGNIMRLTQKEKRKEKKMVIEQPCQAATTKTVVTLWPGGSALAMITDSGTAISTSPLMVARTELWSLNK